MIENFNKIKDLMSHTEVDLKKFNDKGNKSAGIRARNNLTRMIKLATEVRRQVLDERKKLERGKE